MNEKDSRLACETISHQAFMVGQAFKDAAYCMSEPSVLFKPKLYIDGNQWCALYGDNIQDGVAGFGDSPEKALIDFNKNFTKPIGV